MLPATMTKTHISKPRKNIPLLLSLCLAKATQRCTSESMCFSQKLSPHW